MSQKGKYNVSTSTLMTIGGMAIRGESPKEISDKLDVPEDEVRRIVRDMNLEGGL